MATNYIIPFWTVLSLILVVMSILIWMAVDKSQSNTSISTGTIGVEYLLHQYLARCVDKTCSMLLEYNGYQAKKGMDIRRTMTRDTWVQETASLLAKPVIHFPRGVFIMNEIANDMKNPLSPNIFLLPDVLIVSTRIEFYRDLLTQASFIVTGENASPFDSYTNDKCKHYLLTLFASVDEKKTKESFDGKIIYDVE